MLVIHHNRLGWCWGNIGLKPYCRVTGILILPLAVTNPVCLPGGADLKLASAGVGKELLLYLAGTSGEDGPLPFTFGVDGPLPGTFGVDGPLPGTFGVGGPLPGLLLGKMT